MNETNSDRGHWGIENSLHWVLDVNFSEDTSRIRKGKGQEIAAAFRRLALSILQRDTTLKENIRGKRLRAGWENRVLEGIRARRDADWPACRDSCVLAAYPLTRE